jgi:hypothetical protein
MKHDIGLAGVMRQILSAVATCLFDKKQTHSFKCSTILESLVSPAAILNTIHEWTV